MLVFGFRTKRWTLVFLLMLQALTSTEGQLAAPRRLRFKVIGPRELLVSWKEPKGEIDGYRFIYSVSGEEEHELQIPKDENKAVIKDVSPRKSVSVRVLALRGTQQSRVLQGKYTAENWEYDEDEPQPQRIKDPSTPEETTDPSEADLFVCSSPVADLVVLVDGSWSIGRLNFRLIRTFLENLVNAFDVGIDKVRIGLAQYSGDPRIEWHLNTYSSKDAVIDAVKNLPYKGGNTLTGLALSFILKNSFKPESGARSDVPKIGILITDGKSQDSVDVPAQNLRDAGVELFAVGVKNADESELKLIASDPDETHVFNVADFSLMGLITDHLTTGVCHGLQQQELHTNVVSEDVQGAPESLWTSEVKARSFRVSWTPAPGSVEKYRVVYYPSTGGQPEEVVVDGLESSVVLTNLNSQTEYDIAVFAVYTTTASEAVRGKETTLALPMVTDLELYAITHHSMRARWTAAEGASGYMVLYAPLSGDDIDETEVKVEDTVTEVELMELNPDTEYTVTVYAMFNYEASEPATAQDTTLSLKPPRNLRVTEIDHSTARIHWEAPSDKVKGYRIIYGQTGAVQSDELKLGPVSSVLLKNLQSVTEFSMAVFALYDGGQSEPLKGRFTTKMVPAPLTLLIDSVTTDSFRLSWTRPADGVMVYRLTWRPLGHSDSQEVVVPGDVDSYVVNDLSPKTEYELLLSAVYKDDSESIAVAGLQTTLDRMTTTSAPSTTTTTVSRLGVTDVQANGESDSQLLVKWELQDADVNEFRVTFVSLRGDRAEETVLVPGSERWVLLEQLLSDSAYKVTVSPVYSDGEDSALSMSSIGRTLPLSPPSNLRVSDQSFTSFRLSWIPPTPPPPGYTITYQPTTGSGGVQEMFVGEDEKTLLIQNLLPGTEYSVQLRASYSTGTSSALIARAQTLLPGVSGLSTYHIDTNSLCVQWQPVQQATLYRIAINSPHNSEGEELSVSGGVSSQCFYDLTPNTLYNVSIYTVMSNTVGPAAVTMATTLPAPTQPQTAPPTTATPSTRAPPPTLPPAKEVCKAAKADLVFLVDGSWSIGDDNFQKILRFLYSTVGSLHLIGPSATQVSIVQFSDEARTEFELNSFTEKESLLDAVKRISYKGGNTKTGRAIKHVKERIFTPDFGSRRGVPRVLVVLTDGRSQDDVNSISKDMQTEGYIIFAIGFADADYGELVNIASKPSERHVFFVDDLDAVKKIEEQLITFVCEAATATCPSMLMSGNTLAGFRMMEMFGLVEKRYSNIQGVSMEPGTFNSFSCYRIHQDALLSQPTRFLHPEGLPSEYTISVLLRLLPETPQEPFALWEILNKDKEPLVGVILDNGGKTLTFFNYDYKGDFQTVTFEGPEIERIFFGSFHKLHLAISKTSAKLVIDCKTVGEKSINAVGNISTDGTEVLGRMVTSRGKSVNSATFQLQMFDIMCSTSWAGRDKCCELPGLRVEEECPALPHSCSCSQESKGPPGPSGPPGGPGIRGSRGDHGEPGPVGPPGPAGETGPPGPQGPPGAQGPNGLSIQGPPGASGEKGDKGDTGPPGAQGVPGASGGPGRDGPLGQRGLPGKDGPQGRVGPPGPIGSPGAPGAPGSTGPPGPHGDQGPPGAPGSKGDRGERGELQSQAVVRSIARQVCEQLIQSHLSRYNSILNQIPSQSVSFRTVPGPPGEQGRPGPPGPQGEPGSQGRTGFPGASGVSGRPGERGLPGEKGEKGSAGVGAQGPRGPPGPPGAPGEGRTGSAGPPGRPGIQGTPGRPGIPGSTGPAGPPGYCDQTSCLGYNIGVQPLPPSPYQHQPNPHNYQNYPNYRPPAPDGEEEEEEEEEEEDPYAGYRGYPGYHGYPPQYYHPNY